MPNLWGQPHPWELADMTHAEWMDVLRATIERWVTAARGLQDFYGKGGPMSLARFNEMLAEDRAAEAEYRAVSDGNVEACARVWERLRQPRSA